MESAGRGKTTIEAGGGRRAIFLSSNFRSRREVLDAVNALFRRILAPCLGGLTYGDDEALQYGADYDEAPPGGGIAELVLLDSAASEEKSDELSDSSTSSTPSTSSTASTSATPSTEAASAAPLDPLAAEAREAGRRILQWTGASGNAPLLIRDPQSRANRPARFGDVAILLRSMRERADRFADALRALGIPVATSSETAFFESTEVLDVLSLLHLLDNARQDIPLAAALRSPLGGFNETELAEIRVFQRDGAFHEAALAMASSVEKSEVSQKLQRFFSAIERWRTSARREPLAGLLREIFQETGYLDYVGGLPGGPHRRARLEGLLERARTFGAFRRPTLFRFLRFVEDLAEREIELAAPPPAPGADVVRILSIHQSKGLEFPIVFAPDLAKRFNFQDAAGNILLDREAGIALNEIVLERGERRVTAMNRVVAWAVRERARAEEARLLYVAMTRARERLVLSATVDFEQRFSRWRQEAGDATRPLAPGVLQSAAAAIDWIGPALAAQPEGEASEDGGAGTFDLPGAHFRVVLGKASGAEDVAQAFQPGIEPEPIGEPQNTGWKACATEEPPWLSDLRDGKPLAADWRADPTAARVAERLAWRYSQRPLADTPAKVSVSEFKSRLQRPFEEGEDVAGFEWRRLSSLRGAGAGVEASAGWKAYATQSQRHEPVFAVGAFSQVGLVGAPGPEPPRAETACRSDGLEATKRGNLLHAILQRLDLGAADLGVEEIARQARAMAEQGFFEAETLQRADQAGGVVAADQAGGVVAADQAGGVVAAVVAPLASFLSSERGKWLVAHRAGLRREQPFCMALPAGELNPAIKGEAAREKRVVLQGIIDALVETDAGLWILDYKTDTISREGVVQRAQAYLPQMALYARAACSILQRPLAGASLVFLAPAVVHDFEPKDLLQWKGNA
ncbi:MAG: PD-(D/E)XK nuclease family protein [Candidatus Sumerlaeota bacterium]|nr:PD-(D/E)XK nuclease family protein [Candidatus Sumerlaeota bacterium]